MSTREVPDFEENDASEAQLGLGKGGVPWPLMLLYLSFLAFFVWYVLEFQLPDFQDPT